MLYVVKRVCDICCEGVCVIYVVRRACAICCEACVCYML